LRKNPLSNMSANGGIITSEFLEIIRGEKVANPKVQPESFATFNAVAPKNKAELDQWIVDSWDRLRERWDSLSNRYLKMNVSDARSKWMVPLFKELGFDPGFIKEEIAVDGDDKLRFRLSHRGWISAGAPILHMVAPSQDLEEAGDGTEGEVVRRGRSRSPHDELQAYLNVTKGFKWGIVTNGVLLRVLREYYHTTTKGYVEFDIENIFRERSFTDFRAMYRMAHASRFMPDKDGVCPLEQFYKESVTAGVTVGENLRRNVKKAIEALGNGFLTTELAKKMTEDEEFCRAYYSELLRVVYRLLFLLFAEQRAMLPTRDSLYAEEYSIMRLRELAETKHGKDDHFDLWEGLKVTFDMLRRGCPPLKVFGYNGSLFDDSELSILSQISCKNEEIAKTIRHLTLVEEEGALKRINYLDLGVEEIGSIYESLLEFVPKVFDHEEETDECKVPAFAFFLDARGTTRKTTGSYYTNPRLIDELIENALKLVVEEKFKGTEDKDKAILSIRICDPACGSGAFLISANNYLAKELARLRSSQNEPSDREVKRATRDILQHCIYGVDLNPMAVELAKVSLWINSCVEDMPLNFLDHHIKCGNSLIGTNEDYLKEGIPDNAYVSGYGEEKDLSRKYSSINKNQRSMITLDEAFGVKPTVDWISRYEELSDIKENAVEDVELKKNRYASIIDSSEWHSKKSVSDTWTAPFFWTLSLDQPPPPTTATLRVLNDHNENAVRSATINAVNKLSLKYRFFHWHLEFPDIFSKGGFDVVLGNPPFLGGYKIRGAYGDKFTNFLDYRYEPTKGRADLCAYFFRLAFSILKENGHLGMIATKTIGQGDTREAGLAVIIKNQGTVIFARRFVKWIGAANVEVNLVAIRKGVWKGPRILDGNAVFFVSSRLDSQPEEEAKYLPQNENKSFLGDSIRSIGFVLENEEAERLILSNPKNKDCILPFLTGEDLNTNPRQEPSRQVICFRDWELEKTMNYPDLLKIVQERVKPERDRIREKSERENWWLFARYRGELRKAIAGLSRIIARSRHSEIHSLAYVPTSICCSDATVVFAFDDDYHFSVLQSSIHEVWLRRNASTLRTDIRYTPTTCFDTFPFPNGPSEKNVRDAERIGSEYYDYRRKIMLDRNLGLTEIYNLVHNPEVNDKDVQTMRQLYIEMDLAVLKCYEWTNLDDIHGFFQNERGKTRFGIRPPVQKIILNQLMELNLKQSKEK